MAEQPKPPPRKSRVVDGLKAVGPYLDLGVTFVVAILGGAWLGMGADPTRPGARPEGETRARNLGHGDNACRPGAD